MKNSKIEFPNPVLSSDRNDYINCRFGTIFQIESIIITVDNIIIPISYELTSKSLASLVLSGDASVVVIIQSSAASYRKIFRFPVNQTAMEITIPKFTVIKNIELSGYVIASNGIKDFNCDELNKLYFESAIFEIRKGDILAKENNRIIYIDDDELEKPLTSIFNINRRQNQDDDVEPEFEGEKIEINLRDDLFNLYCNLKDFNNGSLRRYLTGIIVYPVLVEAISKICDHHQSGNDSDLSDRRWFRTIEHKAEKLGINMADYYDSLSALANKLLGEVALDSLKSFKDTLDNEMNSGEVEMTGGID